MQAYLERLQIEGKMRIIVKPRSPQNAILSWDKEKNALRVAIKAEPEKGKANKEVVKYFSKLLQKKIKIVSGLKSRTKVISV